MANAFTTHNITVNDQNLLVGAAGRNNDNEMDIVLNTNYATLQPLERIAVKNYAADVARERGMVYFYLFFFIFSFSNCLFFFLLLVLLDMINRTFYLACL